MACEWTARAGTLRTGKAQATCALHLLSDGDFVRNLGLNVRPEEEPKEEWVIPLLPITCWQGHPISRCRKSTLALSISSAFSSIKWASCEVEFK